MREVTLGQVIAHGNIKEGDKIVCYSVSHIFIGNFKRVMPSNAGIVLDVDLRRDDSKYTTRLDIEAGDIVTFGKLQEEYGVQTVDDGKLNMEISRNDTK